MNMDVIDDFDNLLEHLPCEENYNEQINESALEIQQPHKCLNFNIDYDLLQNCIDTLKGCVPHKEYSEMLDIILKLENGELLFEKEDFYNVFLNEEILKKLNKPFLMDTYKYTVQILIDKYIGK